MKKIIATVLSILMIMCGFAVSANAEDLTIEQQLKAYKAQIEELEQKQISAFEIVQSAKDLALDDENIIIVKASEIWFSAYEEKNKLIEKYEELKKEFEESKKPSYSEEDLMLLAKVIHLEAGSDWLTDEHQQLVGNVILNRVASSIFPNTIKEVIYQKGQYSCASRIISTTPSDRAIKNAKLLLEGLRVCPVDVLYQANFPQGKYTYKVINDSRLGKTYFCG